LAPFSFTAGNDDSTSAGGIEELVTLSDLFVHYDEYMPLQFAISTGAGWIWLNDHHGNLARRWFESSKLSHVSYLLVVPGGPMGKWMAQHFLPLHKLSDRPIAYASSHRMVFLWVHAAGSLFRVKVNL
jgi:hypothetical protein